MGLFPIVSQIFVIIYSFLLISILGNFFVFSLEANPKALPSVYEENGRYGYKSKKGFVVIGAKYEMAFEFSKHAVAFVFRDGNWYCIDLSSEELLTPFIYDNGPDYFSEKFARFVENNKMGFFDESCRKRIPANFDFVNPFENGTSIVCNGCFKEYMGEHYRIVGGKYGVIDTKGKVLVPVEFDSIDSVNLQKKTAKVKKENKFISIKWK